MASSLVQIHNLTNFSSVKEREDFAFFFDCENDLPVHHDEFGMMVFITFVYLMLETIGNFLLICVIMYEKFGMDPQKRTITNQLMSSLCAMDIIFNLIVPTIVFINRVFRAVGKIFSYSKFHIKFSNYHKVGKP